MDRQRIQGFVEGVWDETIVPSLTEYIRIPNKSPLFDASWQSAGHMDKAVQLIETWCQAQEVEGVSIEVVRLEGRTPLLFMEIAGQTDDTIMMYSSRQILTS